jgi:predicted nucleic acid-binding protein
VGDPAKRRRRLRRVVSDTGPVLHLHEARALHLLSLTGEVSIPLAVDDELKRWIPGWEQSRPAWISRLDLSTSAEDWRDWCEAGILDIGEAQAVSLARELSADWFLTDDTAARLIGSQLGLEVHGSLAVVLWAAATGKLRRDAARESLENLFGSSLWLSARVRAEALAALDEIADG